MNDIATIKRRLFSVIPTSSLHMMEFLKLMNVRFASDEETKSAAVTCTSRPELLLNKAFIDTYCKTDEHLFMLVMHELYHVILGHTHLFKRHTEIDNIAFDAVINAILCRMFPGEEYVSFFNSINSDAVFPGCILRPMGDETPARFLPILKNLYLSNAGTYFEVYECIVVEFKKMIDKGQLDYVLLGNHSDSSYEENNPLLKKMLDDMISKWPRELVVNGRDQGGILEDRKLQFEKAERRNHNKMIRLLRKAGVIQGAVSKRKTSTQYVKEDALLPIPDYKDRTLLAKSLMYNQPLLYNSSLISPKVTRDSNVQTLVYLDVSGSVVNDINKFASLLLQPYKNKECLLFVFSTVVEPVTYTDFRKGNYKSTGGTSLDCIFNHYFSLPKRKQTKKILILTDGETGEPTNKHLQLIKKNRLEVYCGLFGSYTKDDMSSIVKYFEEFK